MISYQLFLYLVIVIINQNLINYCACEIRFTPSLRTLLTTSSTLGNLRTAKDLNETRYKPSSSTAFNVKKNKNQIISVWTNCSRDTFEIRLNLLNNFRGLLFAKDFPDECRARGKQEKNITLKLPTSGCGIRSEIGNNGNLVLSVKIMLQMDDKLRQSSDILKIIKCEIPEYMMNMNIIQSGYFKKSYRNSRMRPTALSTATENDSTTTQSSTATTNTPHVRIWLELSGPDASGFVQVGQATTLTVRAVVPGTMGVRVVNCAALDGLGESSQQLLDQNGCPIDDQVMPALHTRFRPAEEGWSKPHEDDIVERMFTATFPAFKFPDRERLHVSCGVQLCKGKCPEVNCQYIDMPIQSTENYLARIEVFNSLAVTAPQIEIDRLRYERRYNVSVEERLPYIRNLHSDGTLCLSISMLAICFCILGLVFLISIIVAVYCLIRSKRRFDDNGSQRAGSTSVFTSSSESANSARFGNKLLFSTHYSSGAFPYGRVY